MRTAINATAFNRGVEPIIRMFTIEQAKEIVQYRGDEELQKRVEFLAQRSNEGMLTNDERSEYEGYVRANKFIAILQVKARKLLASNGS